ncbi:MAG: flippase-like domain-containing protein [Syntrophaceae bacterium]|nr:flippase-like domain-containing protein [Syntrophaceae bacterium]
MNRLHYKQVIKWMLVITIFLFLGKMVWENWNQVKEASFDFRPFPLILSTLIFAFSYFIQIWAWYLITLKLGIAISIRETWESWFYSQLGKYLPGKVWLLLSRFYFYESKGKSKKAISIALYLETATILLAAGFLFLIALIFFKEIKVFGYENQWEWLVVPFILAFIFIHPRILQKIVNWLIIRFKREPISLTITYPDVLFVFFVCILAWLVGGVGFYLFLVSVFPVSSQHLIFLAGALAISSTLGLVALFAPSGLGVREGALVYLLSFLMPSPIAVILSVLTRLWMTLIEMGLIGVVYLTRLFKRSVEKGNLHGKI